MDNFYRLVSRCSVPFVACAQLLSLQSTSRRLLSMCGSAHTATINKQILPASSIRSTSRSRLIRAALQVDLDGILAIRRSQHWNLANDPIWTPPRFASKSFFGGKVRLHMRIRPPSTGSSYRSRAMMGYARASSPLLCRAFFHVVSHGVFRRRFDLFAIVRLAGNRGGYPRTRTAPMPRLSRLRFAYAFVGRWRISS
jgi:hypothetical protein